MLYIFLLLGYFLLYFSLEITKGVLVNKYCIHGVMNKLCFYASDGHGLQLDLFPCLKTQLEKKGFLVHNLHVYIFISGCFT